MKYCKPKIVFATASPRRVTLAQKIKYINPDQATLAVLHGMGLGGFEPVFMPTDVCEVKSFDALSTATANARLKGEAAARETELPVLAFDTVVGVDGRVFGKPVTRDEAIAMFRALCGRTHEVITAVYFSNKGKIIEKSEKTAVTFGAFRDELVYNYVDSGAPFDKAGGYNIDDPAIKPIITGYSGEYDNIVGLPVGLTEKLIEENLLHGENGYSH